MALQLGEKTADTLQNASAGLRHMCGPCGQGDASLIA